MDPANLALLIPILAITVPILALGGIIGLITYYRFRRRRDVQETIRIAIEKGQELPTEFLETISTPEKEAKPRKDQDLRRGVVLIAVGLGIASFGLLVGEDDAVGPLMGIGSIPFLIGAGLTALWVLRTRHDQ
ncbi:MAG: DUF6249 domain-containing protein [Gammaproteobacteria bacterium]|nr:DUF6249 domain-containing protein [Gammaproteobacteria bacterium]MCY4165690.1 DUF6249 domain-containing protein [Gammaproteobacteria bacterium]MCY4256227.1 DUF6249 domain-containing protein [Gammaproteobacteria bacterium]MCY4341273.1 DUF6249 domain-containing protein [Gammaproteobacteria bacterium]